MVWIHYELCESIWGGSPATASIETGIESTDIESPSINKVNESSDCDEVNARGSVQQSLTANDDCSSVSLESESTTATHSESSHEVEVKSRSERRALINEKLKNHNQEKLKRKLPLDSQLVSIAQDEMKVKKQLLDKLDCIYQQYSNTMKSLSSNIEKLTNCITDVCSVFKTSMITVPYMSPVRPAHHHMGYRPLQQQHLNNSIRMSSSQQFNYVDIDHTQYNLHTL